MPDCVGTFARETWRGGVIETDSDELVVEVPVAMVYNGISHAVMMATPTDLEDYALGFSLSEGIVENAAQFRGVDVVPLRGGLEVQVEIGAEPFAQLKKRRRNLAGNSGCGLCGQESLEQLALEARPVSDKLRCEHNALQRAVAALDKVQTLKSRTGGVHGAAWCNLQGEIVLIREDVGRHNALDKLLGALARGDHGSAGFALVTSRASYEMVAKASACGVELLAAVSAPTDFAVRRAEEAGMTLVCFLQAGRHAVYSGNHRLEGTYERAAD
jgi:FdhD protein